MPFVVKQQKQFFW